MSSVQEKEAMKSEDTIGNRLSLFVEYFVSHYKKKLDDFSKEAGVAGVAKTGKVGKTAAGAVGAIAGGALGLVAGMPGPGSKVGENATNYTWNVVSGNTHKQKAKRVTSVFGKIDKGEPLEEILTIASGEIFRCFESQFAEVTDGGGYWTAAMEMLAIDAVNRSIKYISDHERRIEKIDSDLTIQSVILGTSKGIAGIVPLKIVKKVLPKPGHTVFNDGEKWNTSELYDNVGLVTTKGDGTADKYYRKKMVGCDASSQYGYRLLFPWEIKDKLKLVRKLNNDYEEGKTPRKEYEYILKPEETEKILGDVIIELKKKDHAVQLVGVVEGVATANQKLDAILSRHEIIQARKEIWFNVRNPVDSFSGRAAELKDLHQKLQNESGSGFMQRVAAITGLGGIGKTELARKYAEDHLMDYDGNAIWINAETSETLRFSFKELAEELKIPTTKEIGDIKQERDVKSIVKDVYGYFDQVKSLFIFDNAEDYKGIKEFLPRYLHPKDSKPHILITSRNRKWEMGGEGDIGLTALQEFTQEEAETFVKDFLKIKDSPPDLEELTIKLQCFPLALRQAVVYIKEVDTKSRNRGGKGFGIRDYLKKFEKHESELLQKGCFENSDRYTQTVSTTWLVTLERIREDEYGEHAIDILNIMAYLAPDKVQVREIFSKQISEDEDNLWCAIELLHQYSMINFERGVTDIHRLVQEVIRLGLEKEKGEEGVLKSTLELVNNGRRTEKSISHVTSVWTHASKYVNLIHEFYFDCQRLSAYGYSEATPLHLLAEDGEGKVVEAMLQGVRKEFSTKFREIIDANDKYNRTPLYIAAENGHECVVKLLVDNGAKVATKCRIAYNALCTKKASGWSPLHVAAFNGYSHIVKILVDKDESLVNINDSTGRTPADLAASKGQTAVVEFLKSGDKKYLLHAEFRAAQESGNLTALSNFLEALEKDNQLKDEVNSKIGEWAPLHLAAFSNWPEIVKILLRNGARIRDSEDSFTPLHAASNNGHLDVVKLLVEKGAHPTGDVNEDGWTSLHSAAQQGHLEVVKYFIDDLKHNIHVTDKKLDTPLHTAAFHGEQEVVEFLLDRGASIDAANSFGAGPLFHAAMSNNRNLLGFLLNRGAKLKNTTDDGTLIGRLNLSVLHIAAVYNDTEMIENLINRGVDKDIGKDESLTPLHAAALLSSSEAVECLVQHDADINACVKLNDVKDALMNAQGSDALAASSMQGVFKILIWVVCFLASRIKITPGYIWELLNCSVNEHLTGEQSSSPSGIVRWAMGRKIVRNQLDSIMVLVEQRKNPELKRPLDAVIITGEGIGINAKDYDGNTDLHLAVLEGNFESVKYLINMESGGEKADPNIRNNDGKTPLDLAQEKLSKDSKDSRIEEIVTFLRSVMDKPRA